jgi:hypothetical protein
MTSDTLSTIETSPGREIRLDIERTPRAVRVSLRVWTSLNGIAEKVPTGRGFVLDAAQFPSFAQAVRLADQTLASQISVHE